MQFNRVTIMGAGFSGMLAAYSLADYFTEVILIERDTLTKQNVRLGIPQTLHLHVLMKRGQELLEQLIPGILAELKKSNLQEVDWAYDTKWYGPFGVYPQYPSDLKTLHFSRSLLNKILYEQIIKIKNITILHGEIQNILMQNSKFDTIQYADQYNHLQIVRTDLIIDARGRNSTLYECLTKLKWDPLEPIIIKSSLSYASCIYKRKTNTAHFFKQIYLQTRPNHFTTGVVISPIENNYLMITALGLDIHKPPRQLNVFHHFLKTLPNDELQHFLSELEPVSTVNLYRNIINRHHRFGNMKKWPAGIIAIGDACCMLNPVYGQSMTIASKQVMVLKSKLSSLKKNNKSFSEKKVQRLLDRQALIPWLIAISEDQRALPKTNLSWRTRFLHYYLDKILVLAVKNQAMHSLLIEIMHMIRNPLCLFKPTVFFKVLLTRLSSRSH